MPTKSIGLRIDEELLAYLEQRAEREHRTLSNMIISILLDAKEHDDKLAYMLENCCCCPTGNEGVKNV